MAKKAVASKELEATAPVEEQAFPVQEEPKGEATQDNDLVKKYADFLTDPQKMAQVSSSVEEVKEEEGTTEEAVTEEVGESDSLQESPESQSPVAVLKVYGREIPIYSKEDLVRYAQMGVDYALKMSQLKQWVNEIQFIQSNPQVRELISRGLRGEDVSKYISFSGFSEKEEATPIESTVEVASKDVIEKVIERTIQDKMLPYLHTINTTMFIQNLRTQDPKYADLILKTIASWATSPPPNLPKGLLEAMDRDPQTFLAVYNALRNQIIRFEEETKKEASTQKVSKLKSKVAPPILEKGSGSASQIEERMIEDLKSPWDLKDEQFKKLLEEVKLRGRRERS